MVGRKYITVNIDVAGDVTNSQITGVNIENFYERSINFGSGNLFTTILTEYLGLPSLQDLESKFDVWNAKKKGEYHQYSRVFELWEEINKNRINLGTAIKLQDVQLTEFINRVPGYFINQDYTKLVNENWMYEHKQTFSWLELAAIRGLLVSYFGFGDVRFSQPRNNLYLVNAVSSGTEEWVNAFNNREAQLKQFIKDDPTFLGHILKRFIEDVKASENRYRYSGSNDLDKMSLGGFPIVMTSEVYNDIVDNLHRFGAVALKSLTGILVFFPAPFSLAYGVGLPKWCLFVGSRSHVQGIMNPEPMLCTAWTVTIDNNETDLQNEKYLMWLFQVGEKDWHSRLNIAVDIINMVRNKINATALFEFDETQNWFDPYTPFTPRVIQELFQKLMKGKHKGHQFFSEPNENIEDEGSKLDEQPGDFH